MFPKLLISTKNTPTFPLPQLPKPALKCVLQNFDSFQLLAFSLASKKCKNQVISLKKRAYYINVIITRQVNIFIGAPSGGLRLAFYMDHDQHWEIGEYGFKKILETPKSVLVMVCPDPNQKVFKWKNNGFGMNDWLNHLYSVFHYQNLDSINFLEESIEFNIDDLKGAFGRANQLITRKTDCEVFSQLILQKFLPIPKLSIDPAIFENSRFKIPPWILTQNFEKISIGEEAEVPFQMDLDSLLAMNAKQIEITVGQMSLKTINKFMKLWMKGSNSRMERLQIWFRNNGNQGDIMLKGIKHQNIPMAKKRVWKSHTVYGGWDIYRIDGIRATIQVGPGWNHKFEMFVWQD